ncbi:MAG: dephospho-CoA kinase, partial [Giesbergeria sp.]
DAVDADGGMDRARMRSLVFADPAARARLEAIVHPIVLRTIAERTRTALQAGVRLIVLDIPLLVESVHWSQSLDAVLVVDCTSETQIDRVVRRSAVTREQVRSIMAAQASRAQRRAVADAVIFNDGLSLAALDGEVQMLARAFGL